ncbi:MAG: hypothetical protein J7L89_08075 [Bacteroidales bacterium]|nr:hypothetical protein [Bacteroidales bacterium]
MIEEKALLLFHKFRVIRKKFVQDTLNGQVYQIEKVKLEKSGPDDFKVIIWVKSDMTQETEQFDSEYANIYFKEITE